MKPEPTTLFFVHPDADDERGRCAVLHERSRRCLRLADGQRGSVGACLSHLRQLRDDAVRKFPIWA